MKKEELKVGVYRLAVDVTNPKPDRRMSDHGANWMHWVTVPAGMLLKVTEYKSEVELPTELAPEARKAIEERRAAQPLWERLHISNYDGGSILHCSYGLTHRWKEEQVTYRGDKEIPWAGPDLFELVVAALEPAPCRLDIFFSERGLNLRQSADDVIAAMLRHGVITWGHVAAGIALYEKDLDAAPADELPKMPVYKGGDIL